MQTPKRKHILASYLAAILLPFLIVHLQIFLNQHEVRINWSIFYPLVLVTAYFGGMSAGITCILTSILVEIYFFITPKFSLHLNSSGELATLGIFTVMGLFMSYMMGKVRIAKESSYKAESLEKSQGFLDSLLENIPNMVFVKDAQNLRFIRFNKAGEDLIGYPRSDLIGKNDYDFFPKEQADFFTSKDQAVLSGKVIVDIPEEPIETTTGTKILHTKKIPLYGKSGIPEYLLGISEDITEKKKREEERLKMVVEEAALKEREIANRRTTFLAEVSTILATSLDYMETLSKLVQLAIPSLCDWCTVTVLKDNGTFERVVAIHSNSTLSPLIDELFQRYPAKSIKSIRQVIETGTSIFVPEINDQELAGNVVDERHLEIVKTLGTKSYIIVPIRTRNKVLGAIAFVRGDASRRYNQDDLALAEELSLRAGNAIDNALLYEAAQTAIKSRDEFLSITSHELKTPVTSLKLQLQMTLKKIELAASGDTSSKLIQSLDNSLKQVNRLSALIEDLLDVSRIEMGKLTYHFSETDISDLLKEVTERFSEQLRLTGNSVIIRSQYTVHAICDRYRIEQVITNLISNAIKYAPGSQIEISIEDIQNQILIHVTDHGPGIPEDIQKRIFERFERGSPNKNVSGLGIGLYISHQIMQGHQGTLNVKSTLGHGSTFTMVLPKNLSASGEHEA